MTTEDMKKHYEEAVVANEQHLERFQSSNDPETLYAELVRCIKSIIRQET